MINLADISENKLGQTKRDFRREFLNRGWDVEIPYDNSSHYLLTKPDGTKLHIFSSTPPTTSFAAARLANDKFATYQLLKKSNVPQLETMAVWGVDKLDEAINFIKNIGTVVVKPVDGGHGKGITTNVKNEDDLCIAIPIAIEATKHIKAALLQRQYIHESIYDIRILIINNNYIASILRIPARVFGDGSHTIRQLIEIENKTQHRGEAYHANLATIDINRSEVYLKSKINYIPVKGEEIQVLDIANYGAGGETIDVTDDIPSWLIEHAVDAANICGLPVAGVDFMLAKMPKKSLSEQDLDPVMIEINKAPLLSMHDHPTYGVPRNAVARYIDYLEDLS